jgi:hypothetical protein
MATDSSNRSSAVQAEERGHGIESVDDTANRLVLTVHTDWVPHILASIS